MGFFKKINTWFGSLVRKRHIVLLDKEEERWRADISPLTFGAIGVAIGTIFFGVILLLVAYTPLLDLLPGYRTNASRSREELIRSIVRIDSLERKMNDMLTYNENRILVVGGKTPVAQSVKNDSLHRSKSFVAPSREDSLLRQKMEKDDRYRLNKTNPDPSLKGMLNAVSPMYGLISERFTSNEQFGVCVNGAKGAQILAIAEGTVIASEWNPSTGYSIVIQHKNNFLSLYRNLSGVLISKGAQVKSAQAIGYAGSDNNKELSKLEFELWRNGKAVNPELYILF